jgi:hypothetical protein
MENTTTGEIECNVQVSKNVLSENDIDYILNDENVIINKMNIQKMNIHTEKCNHILFSIQMNDSIRKKLIDAFHLPSLENMKLLPLRWCKGDTEEHIDVSHDDNTFDFTHLVYLTSDADGKFIIGDNEYAIEKNVGYKFCEGIKHKTMGCSNERLMIGPFTEDGIQCGVMTATRHGSYFNGGKKMRCSKRRRTQKSSRTRNATRNATRRRSQRKR